MEKWKKSTKGDTWIDRKKQDESKNTFSKEKCKYNASLSKTSPNFQ